MQTSQNLRAELKRCEALLTQMRTSTSLEDLEDAWKNFLGRLERVWNKCDSHFSKSPKWNGWKGRYEPQRKRDPLLAYLVNARGADEHTVADIVEKKPDSIEITAGPSGFAYIQQLMVGPAGIAFEGDGTIKVAFHPARVLLLPIVNRGRTYPVPSEHLGKPYSDTSVVHLASLGLDFYRTVVTAAESHFVKV